MERRELYEPEDIEQLLIERPWNELLEEERAFVLRHLSGRHEYEAMRALLLNVHDDAANTEPTDAPPEVRAHVMDVFRSEQRPQWRIWLNSVPGFLLPQRTSELWRPALAFGSVALVVWLAVLGSRRSELTAAPQLAEVKDTRSVETEQATKEKPLGTEVADQAARTEAPVPSAKTITFTDAVPDAVMDQQAADVDMNEVAQSAEPPESPAPSMMALEEVQVRAPVEDLAKVDASAEREALDRSDDEQKDLAAVRIDTLVCCGGSQSHLVTGADMAQNFTYSNAGTAASAQAVVTTKSLEVLDLKEKAKKRADKKRFSPMADSPDAMADASAYLGLLRAAW